MSAWVKQIGSQVQKHGADNASWYAEWNEPDGTRRSKSCGAGAQGKKTAERLRDRLKAELLTGTYNRQEKRKWADFKVEYRAKVLTGLKSNSAREILKSLAHLERILKMGDKHLQVITAGRIADFKAKRRKERGKKPGSVVAPSTINGDLRNIKAALNVAVDWGWLAAVPKIKFEKVPEKLPTYVTPEHFALIYDACSVAEKPGCFTFEAGDWWRGLLVTAQMSGWRISELLALKWADVDFEAGTCITRAKDNKGGRDEMMALHPIAFAHLEPLRRFELKADSDSRVFPWPHHRRTLDVEFARIQEAAGIHLACNIQRTHDCTPACHRYSFHDERRAFATLNAEHMTRETLQRLMRHRSPQTTDRYINMARQLNPAVAKLHVPDVLKKAAIG